ncbi:MAG: fumarylacetoacetate hydrolase family protein [Chloroflexota bacterium]
MRVVVFDDQRIGVLKDGGVVDVSSLIPGWQPGDVHGMSRLIAAGEDARARVEAAATQGRERPLDQVRLRAPVPAPTHLLAAPVNFGDHRDEMRQQGYIKPGTGPGGTGETADTLGFFMKAAGSISGPGDGIELPVKDYPDRRFDHEGEIAFVVGREAKGVSPENALDFVFGYTILVDVTLRGTPERTEERVQRKSFATFSPMGPCITTADEIADFRQLSVKLWLNGELKQDARASDMIVDIPNLLSRASHVMPLRPGDVYTTGSPPGVGRIVPGDTVLVRCDAIGGMTLRVKARDW